MYVPEFLSQKITMIHTKSKIHCKYILFYNGFYNDKIHTQLSKKSYLLSVDFNRVLFIFLKRSRSPGKSLELLRTLIENCWNKVLKLGLCTSHDGAAHRSKNGINWRLFLVFIYLVPIYSFMFHRYLVYYV